MLVSRMGLSMLMARTCMTDATICMVAIAMMFQTYGRRYDRSIFRLLEDIDPQYGTSL